MHMSIPPRFVIPATKSKDLKSSVSREKLKEESEGLHPTTVAADRELKMMHGGEASASFQYSDDESDGEVDDSDSIKMWKKIFGIMWSRYARKMIVIFLKYLNVI